MRSICVKTLWLLLAWSSVGAQAAAPQRLVSLTPHITELLFSIGAGPQVIATDDASDWPASVKQLPHVANYQSINLERLLALQPDLVLVWSGYQQLMVHQLQALDIPVLVVDSQQLQDLPRDLRLLGEATGHARQAEALALQVEADFQRLKQQYQQRKPVRLLYQLWSPPLTTVAEGSWIQDAIAWCGGDNPFATSPAPYPQISEEAVLLQQPELIISAQDAQSLQRWQQWPALPAVAHQQLKLSQPDRLQRLTLRTVAGIEELCQLIDQARP